MTTNLHDKPFLFRLKLRLLGPFGYGWVEHNELAVIFRMGQYHHVEAGPQFYWRLGGAERVQYVVSMAPDGLTMMVPQIQTRDALQFGVGFSVGYQFDPALLSPDRNAAVWVLGRTPEFRREYVQSKVQRALQAVVSTYNSEQLCQGGGVFAEIENRCKAELQTLVRPLALNPLITMILRFDVPAELRDRFTTSVERNINVQSLSQMLPQEFALLMRSEILDVLKNSANTSQYISLADLASLQNQAALPQRPLVIPGTVNAPKSSPQQPPAIPPSAAQNQARRKRPRSRL